MKKIDVFMLPEHLPSWNLDETTVVVVDILRAGTTMIAALAAGADSIWPCVTIEQAQETAQQKNGKCLLGGERRGIKIDGFDLGNSPGDYKREIVNQGQIVMTTTNGTRAIEAARHAHQIIIGAFVNLGATCRYLAAAERIALLCSGTDGRPTSEDLLFAGCLCAEMAGRQPVKFSHRAHAAGEMWQAAQRIMDRGRSLTDCLCESEGGQNLLKLGLRADIEFAADIDRFDTVARFDPSSMSFVAVNLSTADPIQSRAKLA